MMDEATALACGEARREVNAAFAEAKSRAAAWDLPKEVLMPTYLTAAVGDIQVGDIWMQAGDEVRISEAPESYVDPDVGDMVRIRGRIIKGWGAGTKKIRTWSFKPTQTLEVRR